MDFPRPAETASAPRSSLPPQPAKTVHERGIEPHIPVFGNSTRTDGTFSREDFTYHHAGDTYGCPGGKILQHYRRRFTTAQTGVSKDNMLSYRASKHDCERYADHGTRAPVFRSSPANRSSHGRLGRLTGGGPSGGFAAAAALF